MGVGSTFQTKEVEAFGYPITYSEAGAGEAIVSFPGSAGLEMSRAKDELAKSFRVIEVNPPGWGDSPSLTGTMRQRELALILLEALSLIGVERYSLIGTSMGGANAMWAAFHRPEQVRSIYLEGPMLFALPENLVNPNGGPPAQQLLRSNSVSYDPTMYPAPPPHPDKPWADSDFFHEQMRRRFKMFAYTSPGDEQPLLEFTATTSVPITLMLGTEDEILRKNYAERFKNLVPAAAIEIVEGANHDIQNSASDAFVKIVRNN